MSIPFPRIEFYEQHGGGLLDACRSAAVPRTDEYIYIGNWHYRVLRVAWSLHVLPSGLGTLLASVYVEKLPIAKEHPQPKG